MCSSQPGQVSTVFTAQKNGTGRTERKKGGEEKRKREESWELDPRGCNGRERETGKTERKRKRVRNRWRWKEVGMAG